MSIGLLDTPLRLTWDLHGPNGAMPGNLALLVAEQVVQAQLFYVTLEQQPLRHPEYSSISSSLIAGGCQLLTSCSGTEEELSVLPLLPGMNGLLLQIDAFITEEGPDYNSVDDVLQRCRDAGVEPGLSLIPKRSNIKFILSLVNFCSSRNITRFKLPNYRIDDNFSRLRAAEILQPEDVEALHNLSREFSMPDNRLQLEIHDLFLWEILTPDAQSTRSEYGGCQAGNSLAHVDSQGAVFPCMSWPQPLGNLKEQSLQEIWQSSGRHEIRREIASVPSGCMGCRDYPICFGGCRGLSSTLKIAGGRDAMCKEPR